MPSSHLILCRPLLLLPPFPPSIRVFSNESTLRMRWPKYCSFSFSIIPSKESEKAMAPHSSTLAWQIPWTEEPSRLQSMGSLRVGYDWATSLSLFTFMNWRKKWQPTPVFLPGESQGRGSLVGCPSMGSHRVGHDWSDLAAVAVPKHTQDWSPLEWTCWITY